MIRALRPLARSRSGATAAEFALTLPLFLAFTFVFFGVGALFWANAGLRNGVGEGARVATLFPRRSNTEIQNAVLANSFGLGSVMTTPTVTAGTANSQDFVDITVTVTPRFDLFIIEVEPITMSETRRVYRPA